MGAALGNHDAADRCGTGRTGSAGLGVDLVMKLEGALLAVGVDVVRDGGTTFLYRESEYLPHGRVEPLRAGSGEPVRTGPGVDASPEENLVDVDIAEAAEEALIEQQTFEQSTSGVEAVEEAVWRDLEWIGAQAGGRRGEVADRAELADVVELEVTVRESEDGTGVGVTRGVPEQETGHAELDGEVAAVELEEDLFAVATDIADGASGEIGDWTWAGTEGEELGAGD